MGFPILKPRPFLGPLEKDYFAMSDFDRNYARTVPADRADMSVDAGLRSFMLGVYNKLAIGVAISGALAWITGTFPPVRDMLFTPSGGSTMLGMVVAFAPLGVLLFGMGAARTARGASVIYWLLVSLIGASLGYVFVRYGLGSISTAFLSTAVAFGGLSLWGYTTKKNISGWGSFLFIGLIGVIVASLLNIFLKSPALYFVINAAVVLVFAGFMAFDTQRLKMMYYQIAGDREAMGVATSMGALSLYLNIINMFQAILALFGSRD
jgi:uncharacterized protein